MDPLVKYDSSEFRVFYRFRDDRNVFHLKKLSLFNSSSKESNAVGKIIFDGLRINLSMLLANHFLLL